MNGVEPDIRANTYATPGKLHVSCKRCGTKKDVDYFHIKRFPCVLFLKCTTCDIVRRVPHPVNCPLHDVLRALGLVG